MHMERIESGVDTKHRQSNLSLDGHIFSVLKFNSLTRMIYGALAQFCVHMERSY